MAGDDVTDFEGFMRVMGLTLADEALKVAPAPVKGILQLSPPRSHVATAALLTTTRRNVHTRISVYRARVRPIDSGPCTALSS